MYKTRKIIIIILLACFLMFNTVVNLKLKPYIYLNTSKSLPRGFYVVKAKAPKIKDLVVVALSSDKERLLLQQGVEFKQLLLKPIVAIYGDYICNKGDSILVNNKISLHCHNKLELARICRTLMRDEFFIAINDQDNSLDSRYFGVVTAQEIKAVVEPLLVF